MKYYSFILIILSLMLLGCKNKKSAFKLKKDFFEFTDRMQENDTLKMWVNLSNCMWQESDYVEITKSNKDLFFQIVEKKVMFENPIKFPKVLFKLNQDTLNIETIAKGLELRKKGERYNGTFFHITNPKEQDTLIFKTEGLSGRLENIELYQRIVSELYPEEIKDFRNKHYPKIPPPPPPSSYEENKVIPSSVIIETYD